MLNSSTHSKMGSQNRGAAYPLEGRSSASHSVGPAHIPLLYQAVRELPSHRFLPAEDIDFGALGREVADICARQCNTCWIGSKPKQQSAHCKITGAGGLEA